MTQCLVIAMNASNPTLSAKGINGCSTDNGNVLAVAIKALSEGYGADMAKCEGSDPLHDFILTDGTPTPTANHGYGDYNVSP